MNMRTWIVIYSMYRTLLVGAWLVTVWLVCQICRDPASVIRIILHKVWIQGFGCQHRHTVSTSRESANISVHSRMWHLQNAPYSCVLFFFLNIISMLCKGFEMECIHRCISQMSCCRSKSVSPWAVSHLFFLFDPQQNGFGRTENVVDGVFYFRVLFVSPQLFLLIWKPIFMHVCP